jgi:alkanesulfonate monooxygenase SsuD/methylene tetrahydromethanopterin reductase-like flavin-dependent oxidoreductase (luciferase family)
MGQAFALRNCDAFFAATVDSKSSIEARARRVVEIKRAAREFGRDIGTDRRRRRICQAAALFRLQGNRQLPAHRHAGPGDQELANFSKAGMRGIALSFVNDLDELPYFRDEVLPRLVRLKVRQPH